MKMTLKTLKPRNPFVVAGLRRNAGSHQVSAGASRQQAQQSLRKELDRLRPSP